MHGLTREFPTRPTPGTVGHILLPSIEVCQRQYNMRSPLSRILQIVSYICLLGQSLLGAITAAVNTSLGKGGLVGIGIINFLVGAILIILKSKNEPQKALGNAKDLAMWLFDAKLMMHDMQDSQREEDLDMARKHRHSFREIWRKIEEEAHKEHEEGGSSSEKDINHAPDQVRRCPCEPCYCEPHFAKSSPPLQQQPHRLSYGGSGSGGPSTSASAPNPPQNERERAVHQPTVVPTPSLPPNSHHPTFQAFSAPSSQPSSMPYPHPHYQWMNPIPISPNGMPASSMPVPGQWTLGWSGPESRWSGITAVPSAAPSQAHGFAPSLATLPDGTTSIAPPPTAASGPTITSSMAPDDAQRQGLRDGSSASSGGATKVETERSQESQGVKEPGKEAETLALAGKTPASAP